MFKYNIVPEMSLLVNRILIQNIVRSIFILSYSLYSNNLCIDINRQNKFF